MPPLRFLSKSTAARAASRVPKQHICAWCCVFLARLGGLGLKLGHLLAHNPTPSCGTSNSELKAHCGARNNKKQVHPPGARPYIAELRPFSASVLRISASMATCGKSNYCRNRRGLKFDWPSDVLRISASGAAHAISYHIAAKACKAS